MAFPVEQMELKPVDRFLDKIRTGWTVSLPVEQMGAQPVDRSCNSHNFSVFWLSFKCITIKFSNFFTVRKSKNMSNKGDTTFGGNTTFGLQRYK